MDGSSSLNRSVKSRRFRLMMAIAVVWYSRNLAQLNSHETLHRMTRAHLHFASPRDRHVACMIIELHSLLYNICDVHTNTYTEPCEMRKNESARTEYIPVRGNGLVSQGDVYRIKHQSWA